MSSSALVLAASATPQQLQAACGSDPHFWCRQAHDVTHDRTLAQLAGTVIGLPLGILAILVVAAIVNRFARRAVHGVLARLHTDGASLRAQQRIDALSGGRRSIDTAVVFTIAGFMALDQIGVNLAPLLTGAGIVGIALGFGAQSLVKDFLSGIFILVEDQFGVGDVVEIDAETSGSVELISLRTTRLRAGDGTVWHVPNGEIRRVGNKSQNWSRSVLDLLVAYDADLGRAQAVMKQVADEVWHSDDAVLEEPEVWGVNDLGPRGVKIGLRDNTTPSEQWRVSRVLRERIKVAFDREGIGMPAAAAAVVAPAA